MAIVRKQQGNILVVVSITVGLIKEEWEKGKNRIYFKKLREGDSFTRESYSL